jgi:hypothetical protein
MKLRTVAVASCKEILEASTADVRPESPWCFLLIGLKFNIERLGFDM